MSRGPAGLHRLCVRYPLSAQKKEEQVPWLGALHRAACGRVRPPDVRDATLARPRRMQAPPAAGEQLDLDAERKVRTREEMAEEAGVLRAYFQ